MECVYFLRFLEKDFLVFIGDSGNNCNYYYYLFINIFDIVKYSFG